MESRFWTVADNLTRTDMERYMLNELIGSFLDIRMVKAITWQNADMRGVSAGAAAVAASTMTAWVQGMNFTHRPQLN